MPNLDNLGVPRYDADHPYHYTFDNAPLEVLEQRDVLINDQVDAQGLILEESAGTQGTLPRRLDEFANADGTLKASAIDDAEHSIAAHTDGGGYFRMTEAQKDLLDTVASGATDITFSIETDSGPVLIDSGQITLAASADLKWIVDSGPIVSAEIINYPRAHIHFYEIVPEQDPDDSKLYLIPFDDLLDISDPLDGTLTTFREGSLAVYVNGVRLNQTTSVYYPSLSPVTLSPTDDDYSIPAATVIAKDWKLNKFTVNPSLDSFTLDEDLSEGDVVFVDFECDL